ncbi:aldehyde ferredoxin oxidoreductase N-terminal domain-containing protein, partial [Chloroflexota bacterium]
MYGQILKVDLSSSKIKREPISSELRHKYLGGEGINTRLLWEHFLKVDPRIDPLSSDNVLILGIGPLAGTPLGAGSKMKFTFKSPHTKIYGDSTSGGGLGAQLRWAGYDHIVINGRAERPVYLWIDDDEVTIREAHHLWGKNASEADEIIKSELGDDQLETACIGQAGENLVPVASVMLRRHRAAARMGGGCVFGSKNLKAIAARGTKGLRIHKKDAFFQAMNDFWTTTVEDPDMDDWTRYGTTRFLGMFREMGFNAYRNAQGLVMPEKSVRGMDHVWYNDNIGIRAL